MHLRKDETAKTFFLFFFFLNSNRKIRITLEINCEKYKSSSLLTHLHAIRQMTNHRRPCTTTFPVCNLFVHFSVFPVPISHSISLFVVVFDVKISFKYIDMFQVESFKQKIRNSISTRVGGKHKKIKLCLTLELDTRAHSISTKNIYFV